MEYWPTSAYWVRFKDFIDNERLRTMIRPMVSNDSPTANEKEDLFSIDILSENEELRLFLTEKVRDMLSDPSIDAEIERLLQEGDGVEVPEVAPE